MLFLSLRVDKKRDKIERKILDSQERAFWDVHRPVVSEIADAVFIVTFAVASIIADIINTIVIVPAKVEKLKKSFYIDHLNTCQKNSYYYTTHSYSLPIHRQWECIKLCDKIMFIKIHFIDYVIYI